MGKEMTRSELADMLGVPEERLDETIMLHKKNTDQIMSAIVGDAMSCFVCGKTTPIHWAQDHLSWSVECLCGWSAAGAGPPTNKN